VISDGNPPVIPEKRNFANVICDYHLNPWPWKHQTSNIFFSISLSFTISFQERPVSGFQLPLFQFRESLSHLLCDVSDCD
jgi:hypothetical protein